MKACFHPASLASMKPGGTHRVNSNNHSPGDNAVTERTLDRPRQGAKVPSVNIAMYVSNITIRLPPSGFLS